MTQEDWPQRMTHTVAGEIRRYRLARGLSAQQLADRCAEIGMPIRRSVLANLENGRRDAITVAELLVLARALEVSPVLLVFPVGRQEEVEPLPGQSLSTWDAVLWLSGMARLHAAPDGLNVEWADADDVIPLYQQHEQLLSEWASRPREALGIETEEGQRQHVIEMREVIISELLRVRAAMRDRGLTQPQLPEGLAHIDRPPENSSLRAGPARGPWRRR